MPPRLRPTRIEHVVDGVKLRSQLSAAALSIDNRTKPTSQPLLIRGGSLGRSEMR